MVLVKSFEDTKKNLTNITSVLNTAKIPCLNISQASADAATGPGILQSEIRKGR